MTAPLFAQSEAHVRPNSLLLVGNFLSATTGVRSVSEDLATQLVGQGWPVLTTSTKPGRWARLGDMLNTIWRRRLEYNVAHVEVYSGPAFVWAEATCTLLARLGKPFILTLHGGNLPNFARRWPGRVRRLLKAARAVTTPSRYLFEQMQPYRDDLRLLPNPLPLERYQFRARNPLQPRLLWLRAFHAIYNPALAPQVVAQLTTEFPALHLTMLGPDKGDGSLQSMQQTATALGVIDRINQMGAVPKNAIPGWLDKADIFLNTTNVDNTPVSILEAMASGLCVVSTNVGGLPYLLEHERDALLVPPNNPAALAAAVRRLLTEPTLAASLALNARRKVEQWDWALLLPQWQELLSLKGVE